MKRTMTKDEILAKIVDIDVQLSNNRFDRKLSPEQYAKLRVKRDNLEKKLYK